MRISDWSSDVCSSDLRRLEHRQSRSALRPPGACCRWLVLVVCLLGAATGPGPDHGRPLENGEPDYTGPAANCNVATGPKRRIPEIGRASGRERGCQYG